MVILNNTFSCIKLYILEVSVIAVILSADSGGGVAALELVVAVVLVVVVLFSGVLASQ